VASNAFSFEDADDHDYDQQFDQGEALRVAEHDSSIGSGL